MGGEPVDTQVRVRFSSWYVRVEMVGVTVMERQEVEGISQSHYLLTIESMRIQSHIERYLIAIIIRNSAGEDALIRGCE